MAIKTPITIASGDGIGPEIMSAVLSILDAAQAQIQPEFIEVGEKIYLQGETSGIPHAAFKSIERTRILLKGPIKTPQGGGYKSLNVTLRKTFGLFANVRPCNSFTPYVRSNFPNIDLVIVRENEEDLYAGIEYRDTDEVYEAVKMITRRGCQRIVEYAFEYARKFNRKKVTCVGKDNIMKMTDGLFHRIFDEVAKEYPEIAHDYLIVDIGTALIASRPTNFDVIVTSNLYGDIISDVAAQVAGSIGLAGSANIGHQVAMFEAVHGSAPDIAGKDIANPSGLLNAAVQMLVHINQPEVASYIENAWLKTLEDGIHTADIYSEEYSKQKVGTQNFAEAVIQRLGQKPAHLRFADYQPGAYTKIECYGESATLACKKELTGVDVYLDNAQGFTVSSLVDLLSDITGQLKLITITSRGLKIWPDTFVNTYLPQCCCRFQSQAASQDDVLALLNQLHQKGLTFFKVQHLRNFDGIPGFTLPQGH